MLSIEKRVLVPYERSKMFELVNNVEAYPQFLPWCHSVTVENQSQDELYANVRLGNGPFNYIFQTHNMMEPYHRIEVRLKEGPFRSLEGVWEFHAKDSGCEVSLKLMLELMKKTANLIAKPVLPKLADTMVQAFCRRADELYGHENDKS